MIGIIPPYTIFLFICYPIITIVNSIEWRFHFKRKWEVLRGIRHITFDWVNSKQALVGSRVHGLMEVFYCSMSSIVCGLR
jgi:hypothetical protein